MSNKAHDRLIEIERLINRTYPAGMDDGHYFTIKRVVGFELFNTRPYHNYETWSCGYNAEDIYGNRYSAEDLDDCIRGLCEKRLEQIAKQREVCDNPKQTWRCSLVSNECDRCKRLDEYTKKREEECGQ